MYTENSDADWIGVFEVLEKMEISGREVWAIGGMIKQLPDEFVQM